jgi:hypothetical protein
MDDFCTRLDALEQQTAALAHHTRHVTRQLRWWRGLACGLLVSVVLTWALPFGIAQENASTGGHKGHKGLEQRVAALENLLQHFSRKGNDVFITGANLHIVNGLDSTDCINEQFEEIPDCPNGLGNLIIGYNEPRPEGEETIRTGSHNVVVGQEHNFSRFGGLVVGLFNTISGDFATVSGGIGNTASREFATVSGGSGNMASDQFATVSGGSSNTANGFSATVSGGQSNTASGLAATVSGGVSNTASGFSATVSGGILNTASGDDSSVSGGDGNTATGNRSSVSGGRNRTAAGEFDWVAGSLFEDE